jgi:hypothetical protein
LIVQSLARGYGMTLHEFFESMSEGQDIPRSEHIHHIEKVNAEWKVAFVNNDVAGMRLANLKREMLRSGILGGGE